MDQTKQWRPATISLRQYAWREAEIGTFRKWWSRCAMSAVEGRPEAVIGGRTDAIDPTETLAAGLDALTCEVPCFAMVSTWRLRRIKTATSNLDDLGNAAETGRTCATGAPYCLPFAPLICEPSRGSAVGIEWGNRGGAAGDIEDLASKLCCWGADSDVACRDLSDRGIAPERRNAECESC